MRLIDADALMKEMQKAYLMTLDDVLDVIDEMPPIRPPLKLEWSDGVGNDDYRRGYTAGWNMYLATIESQIVKAREAKQ